MKIVSADVGISIQNIETFDHTVNGPAKLHKPNRIFACQNIGVG